MSDSPAQRVVAIVGRPNVGKSALFNRMAGRRIAIVHEESGVTRDRISCEVTWEEHRFELIDTGGLALIDKARTAGQIEEGTRKQVDVALQDAAVVVFVTDITAGVVALDEEVARLLHESGRKVLLAVNKADNERLETRSPEFEALGFPVFPVSAIQNRGIQRLVDGVLAQLPPGHPPAAAEALKVTVVGRPNVGKSSYVNALLGSERVIVSETPGTTRDSIEIPFVIGQGEAMRRYVLIDTAGMRKHGRVKDAVERFSLLRAEGSIERADIVVLMLDAADGPTEQDKKIAAKIMECRKGCVLLVNKWDLAGEVKQRHYEDALKKHMFFFDFVPVVFASASTGYNIRRSVEVVDLVAEQVSASLTTGVLNRVLRDAVERVQPPQVKGQRMKLYYGTQTGARPLRFRLFVNEPHAVTPAYRNYLLGCLREAFGFEGAPVVLDFRSSHGEKTRKRARFS